MKNLIIAVLILLVFSCKKESTTNENTKKATTSKSTNASCSFSASLGDKKFEVDVNCMYLDKDYFIFDSDARGGLNDTNGDGIIVSGNQDGKKLSLIIVDNGKSYSAGNITIVKNENGATGSGTLFLQEGGEQPKVSFSIVCLNN